MFLVIDYLVEKLRISCTALQMIIGLADSSHIACCGGGRH